MKNRSMLITKLSIIVLMLLPVTFGHTNPCAVGTLRSSVLTERTESVLSVAFNPQHNDILAVGRSDGTIELWNVESKTPLHTLAEHIDIIFALAFSPNGNMLASGSADGTVRLWNTTDIENLTSIEELWEPFTGHTDIVLSLAFSADGKTLASGSRDGTLWLWNLSDPNKIEQQNIFPGTTLPPVLSLAFSMEGNKLATGRDNGTIRVWDLVRVGDLVVGGNELYTFKDPTDPVLSLAFSADDNILASGSADGTVRLWDTNASIGTNKTLHEFSKHGDWVNSVAFHGTRLASAGFDNVIHLWDVSPESHLYELTGHADSIESVAFSLDGSTLASGGHDGKVLLWKLTPTQIVGDVNNDTYVNSGDMQVVDSSLGVSGQNIAEDVNCDGVVNISDLVLVANEMKSASAGRGVVGNGADVNGNGVDISDLEAVNAALGKTGSSLPEDVNKDGVVNISDLVLVANEMDLDTAAAPTLHSSFTRLITAEQVQQWLTEAGLSTEISPAHQRGIWVLEQLLASLKPSKTALLPNYPNPFNPETWIPYQLEQAADVTVTIYAANGTLVRTLQLGHQPAGTYENRARAAYWDGKNEFGESVASGLYFYTLTAGDFTATRKLLVRK